MFDQYKVIGTNLNDTLFEGFTSEPLSATPALLDAVGDRPFIVVINQAGPVWHYIKEHYQPRSQRDYPGVERLAHTFITMCKEFPVLKEAYWYISMGDQRAIDAIETGEKEKKNTPGVNALSGQQVIYNIACKLLVLLHEGGITKASTSTLIEDRKPKPGMFLRAVKDFKLSNPEQLLYIGSHSGGYYDDENAAKAAGCSYMDITEAEKHIGYTHLVVSAEEAEAYGDYPF